MIMSREKVWSVRVYEEYEYEKEKQKKEGKEEKDVIQFVAC